VIVTSHGGNSAAMSLVAQDLRAHHGLLVVTTSWSRFGAPDGLFSAEEIRHGIHGGAVETSIMLARYPHTVRKEAIADFHPASIAMEQKFRWLSAHRPVPFAWQTQDLHEAARSATPPKLPRRRANNCSITARARSANCSMTSTNSIRNCFFAGRRPDLTI
jgi:creatinine amidohydrolase/Fe(II)-dependent formamide hydrolase-like protein